MVYFVASSSKCPEESAETSVTSKCRENWVSEFLSLTKTSFYVFFHMYNRSHFPLCLYLAVFFYLSTSQRSACNVNCLSRGGCRPCPGPRTPCGCSETPAPPPGSWAPWLGGCPSSAASQRAGLCWEEKTWGIRKCTVTARWIQWFTWSLTLGGVTARTTLSNVFVKTNVYSVQPW